MRELERRVVLSVLDRKWREHLYEMDYLQEGIGLRAMAQRDPLVEYQREGFDMFAAMMDAIKEESVGYLFNLEVQVDEPTPRRRRRRGRGAATRSSPRASRPRSGRRSCSTPRRPSTGTRTARAAARRCATRPDDEYADTPRNAPVPLRLGQEVQALPRRPAVAPAAPVVTPEEPSGLLPWAGRVRGRTSRGRHRWRDPGRRAAGRDRRAVRHGGRKAAEEGPADRL